MKNIKQRDRQPQITAAREGRKKVINCGTVGKSVLGRRNSSSRLCGRSFPGVCTGCRRPVALECREGGEWWVTQGPGSHGKVLGCI